MNRYAIRIALLVIGICASPASASDFGRFWAGFKGFWGGLFGSVGGVAGVAILTGIAGIFIITRGKWMK